MKELVKAENINFYYGNTPVIKNTSFKIEDKEFVCVVGPNGGGKTTLLKLILGILKVTKGSLSVLSKRPGACPHQIAYLPQYINFDPLFPITVYDVVLMGCLGHSLGGHYSKEDHQKASWAITTLKITNLKNRSFQDLSGGQRQRVLLARALTCRPKLLLLDEPTSNIDNQTEKELFNILKELNKNMAIIMVSHDYYFVTDLASKVFCIHGHLHQHPLQEFTKEKFISILGNQFKWIDHQRDH